MTDARRAGPRSPVPRRPRAPGGWGHRLSLRGKVRRPGVCPTDPGSNSPALAVDLGLDGAGVPSPQKTVAPPGRIPRDLPPSQGARAWTPPPEAGPAQEPPFLLSPSRGATGHSASHEESPLKPRLTGGLLLLRCAVGRGSGNPWRKPAPGPSGGLTPEAPARDPLNQPAAAARRGVEENRVPTEAANSGRDLATPDEPRPAPPLTPPANSSLRSTCAFGRAGAPREIQRGTPHFASYTETRRGSPQTPPGHSWVKRGAQGLLPSPAPPSRRERGGCPGKRLLPPHPTPPPPARQPGNARRRGSRRGSSPRAWAHTRTAAFFSLDFVFSSCFR